MEFRVALFMNGGGKGGGYAEVELFQIHILS